MRQTKKRLLYRSDRYRRKSKQLCQASSRGRLSIRGWMAVILRRVERTDLACQRDDQQTEKQRSLKETKGHRGKSERTESGPTGTWGASFPFPFPFSTLCLPPALVPSPREKLTPPARWLSLLHTTLCLQLETRLPPQPHRRILSQIF